MWGPLWFIKEERMWGPLWFIKGTDVGASLVRLGVGCCVILWRINGAGFDSGHWRSDVSPGSRLFEGG